MKIFRYLAAMLLALPLLGQPVANLPLKPGRDASQAVDEEYTRKIREYTTETFFNSPLTDYLPASKTVPTPKVVLGGRLSLHAHAGAGHPARQSLQHRQDRGRPRDDRRGCGVRTPARHARREPRAPRQTRRSAHHQAGRRRGARGS